MHKMVFIWHLRKKSVNILPETVCCSKICQEMCRRFILQGVNALKTCLLASQARIQGLSALQARIQRVICLAGPYTEGYQPDRAVYNLYIRNKRPYIGLSFKYNTPGIYVDIMMVIDFNIQRVNSLKCHISNY